MDPTPPPTHRGWRSHARVAASTLGAVVLVLVVNTVIFLLFVMPPILGALWVAGVGAAFVSWHMQTDAITGRRRLGAWMSPRLSRVGAEWIAAATLWTILFTFGLVQFIQVFTGALDMEATPFHQRILEYTGEFGGWLAFAFAASIVVPIVEEFAFRGRLLSTALQEWGRLPAVALSAGAFALVHLGGPHLALLAVPLVVGTFCAILVLVTRSIWPAVILHGTWNGLLALIALIPESALGEMEPTSPGFGLVGAALLMTAGGLGWAWLLRPAGPARAPLPERPSPPSSPEPGHLGEAARYQNPDSRP